MTDVPPPPLPPARRSGWRRLQRLPLTMMIASALLGLGIVQLTFQLGHSLYRTITWTQETQATRAQILTLERDVKILQDAVRAAQEPAHLRELARCRGFVGAGEQVIVASDAPDMSGENCRPLRVP
ncbi:cell division protein FtsB [Deinococcus taeanensis]|uniref:cell division protein FtsB n=1 Tax=Deinococcus taeanensis TaxID=2737050 RepID=UPI001CDC106F|nr:cell division protein FtsB [Deinococcus taeanensis]UBV42438.1 cell division protein FtsB [Deinococcus taeanensis]